jgi:hypothetical protein
MRRSWGTKRASMMQAGGEVQARPSETATPACGARGGRPLFAAFARLCTVAVHSWNYELHNEKGAHSKKAHSNYELHYEPNQKYPTLIYNLQ